jgi:hypothetical protein
MMVAGALALVKKYILVGSGVDGLSESSHCGEAIVSSTHRLNQSRRAKRHKAEYPGLGQRMDLT